MSNKRYPSCILAACCVPWNEDGSLAEEIFRHEIRNLLTNLTRDIYLFGTAGEGYAVTEEQFDQIVHVFREETNLPIITVDDPLTSVVLGVGKILDELDLLRKVSVMSQCSTAR